MGRSPHPRPIQARPVVRTGPVPRAGPTLAARPLPADRIRAPGRDRGLRRARDRSLHADSGSAPRRASARPRPSTPELRSELEAFCAGVNAAAADRPLPAEFQLLRLEFEPFTPGGRADAHEAPLVRPLDQLGARAPARRDGPRAGARAGRAARPRLSARATRSCSRPGERLGRRRARRSWSRSAEVRDAIGLAVEATGSNNWAVAASRSATGGPLLAGDPHLPPGMPGITYQVGLYLGDRFCRGASLPGLPGVIDGPEQRRRLVVHERDGRRHGPVHRAHRRRHVRVRGRASGAGEDRGGDPGQGTQRARAAGRPPRPTTGRSSTRRSAPTTPSRWRCASRRSTFRGSPRPACGSSTSRAAPSSSRRSPSTHTRSRTSSGPTATARSATRRWAGSRSAAAAAPICPSPAGRASTSGTAGSPTTSCRR